MTNNMITIKQFVNRYKVKASSKLAESNPHMIDEQWNANHYKVTLKTRGRQYTLYFSKGVLLTGDPTAEEVLSCLALDAASIENSRSFEDWASDLGYDPDSRRAEKIYNGVVKSSERLKILLGDEGYNQLLWDTEDC